MGIPAELRLHILSFLLPDVERIRDRTGCRMYPTAALQSATILIRHQLIQQAETTGTYRWSDDPRSEDQNVKLYPETQIYMPLRHDLERCWPKVLRCNRQMYKEGLPLMYEKKTFEVDITRDKFVICSRSLAVETPPRYKRDGVTQDLNSLRTWIGHISSLDVFLQFYYQQASQSVADRFDALIATAQRFHASRLRKVSITLGVDDRPVAWHHDEYWDRPVATGYSRVFGLSAEPSEERSDIESLLHVAGTFIFKLASAKIQLRGMLPF